MRSSSSIDVTTHSLAAVVDVERHGERGTRELDWGEDAVLQ